MSDGAGSAALAERDGRIARLSESVEELTVKNLALHKEIRVLERQLAETRDAALTGRIRRLEVLWEDLDAQVQEHAGRLEELER